MLAMPLAPTGAAVRTTGTARIETAAAIRIVESANTQLGLAHAGIILAVARAPDTLAPTNFLVAAGAVDRRRGSSVARHSGAGTNSADEALSVSVSDQRHDSTKVSGALTLILANYY